jgi:RNA polymerase sigma-70 factor (ECF subfamily)
MRAEKERDADRKNEDAADLADIAEVLRGNTAAFRGIVERYKGLVFRLSLSYLNNPEDAEEASQEIFIRAFRALRSFSLERRFLPWLYAICANHLKTRWGRLRGREVTRLSDGAIDRLPGDASADPQEMLQTQDARESVRRAVKKLPPTVRDAVFLYYFEGMSVEQVSTALGVGTENVKSKLMRARKKLRESLAPSAGTREAGEAMDGGSRPDATEAGRAGYNGSDDSGGGTT